MLLKRNLAISIGLFVVLAAESLTVKHTISAQTGVPTTPTAVPAQQNMVFNGMGDMTFLNAQDGWMFADYRITSSSTFESLDTVDTTTDGGRTWQTRSVLCPSQTKLCPENLKNNDPVPSLRFANTQDGWGFGPGFFVTHDGGVTWQQEAISGRIVDLEIVDGAVVALQNSCAATEFSGCTFTIWRSTNNGYTWQTRQLPSAIIDVSRFIPIDRQNLWLLGNVAPNPVAPQSVYGNTDEPVGYNKPLLLSTNNGGLTWRATDIPDQCGDRINVAVVDERNLWLACAYIFGAGSGLTWIYASSDTGASWQLRPKATSDYMEDNVISSMGYLDGIYAFSAQSAWVTFQRSPPLSTNDGGKSWHGINGLGDFEQGISVIHVDDQHIWVYNSNLLLGTSDGGLTWVCQRANYDYGDGGACYNFGGATDPRSATPEPQQ